MATRPYSPSIGIGSVLSRDPSSASSNSQFREIHKNSWLKRLTKDGKKVTVGYKKSERSWVVFCVHDDSDPFLEAYAEPKHALSHAPEWLISIQDTLHISHALIPNCNEFEFVITLSSGVVRFQAPTWEIMQEWVETLRNKLREMRILSPRENLYTKLPEVRSPLLPTRDPTSPLPAPPPVPAAFVPGIERVILHTTVDEEIANEPTLPPNELESALDFRNVVTSQMQRLFESTNIPVEIPETEMEATDVELSLPMSDDGIPNNTTGLLSDTISNNNEQLSEVNTQIVNYDPNVNIVKETFCGEVSRSIDETGVNEVLQLQELDALANRCPPTEINLNKRSDQNSEIPEVTEGNLIKIPRAHNIAQNICKEYINDQHTDNVTIIEVSTNVNYSNNPVSSDKIQVSLTPELLEKTPIATHSHHHKNEEEIVPLLKENNYIRLTSHNIDLNHIKKREDDNRSRERENLSSAQAENVSFNKFTNVVICGENSSNSREDQSIYSKCYPTSTTTTSDINAKSLIVSSHDSGITSIEVNSYSNTHEKNYTNIKQIEQNINVSNSPILLNEAAAQPVLDVKVNTKPSVTTTKITPEEPPLNVLPQLQKSNLNIPILSCSSSLLDLESPKESTEEDIDNVTAGPSSKLEFPQSAIISERLSSNARQYSFSRGVTEAVIANRPSRKDYHLIKSLHSKAKSHSCNANKNSQQNNRNTELTSNSVVVNVSNNEDRKRSSSTSDTQKFRNQNISSVNRSLGSSEEETTAQMSLNHNNNGMALVLTPKQQRKRITLREQQVMQLRREIMHTGGVRLRLRRKDCLGSIAWIEAFGGVWVVGWKQKEHPVLYNALHIGDELISISGIKINSGAEANKVIRNTNTIFVEILLRRVPFGRVYAIRRDREGQCLGLIRDENSATIIDVIPNSLAARHGLPPKAKSCEGAGLTFWVLTEINGRPLNLFFKNNEIRDRLNSVGSDISILVQPLDLITKLKKQLKSLRGYKEYLL